MRNISIVSLLAHLLACKHPVGNQTNSRHWKPSIVETKEAVLLSVTNFNQLEGDLARLTNRCFEKGLPFTPIIIVLGSTNPTGYTLWHNTFSYKFPSFLKTLDICIKLFRAYDIEYPPQSADVWTFLAGYLYEFPIEQPYLVALCAILNKLAQAKWFDALLLIARGNLPHSTAYTTIWKTIMASWQNTRVMSIGVQEVTAFDHLS